MTQTGELLFSIVNDGDAVWVCWAFAGTYGPTAGVESAVVVSAADRIVRTENGKCRVLHSCEHMFATQREANAFVCIMLDGEIKKISDAKKPFEAVAEVA